MAKRPSKLLGKGGANAPRRRRWPVVLVVLLGLAVAGKAGDWALGRSADRRWEQFRESIAAIGQPFTLEEIERSRGTLPPEQNSALLLERLRPSIEAAFAVPPPGDVLVFSVGDDLIDGVYNKNIAPSKAFLAERSTILDGLMPILDMPRGRFPIDLTQPPSDFSLPDAEYIRNAAQLAELGALLSLVDRQRDHALRNILLQFAIAGSLQEDPRVIVRMHQAAITRSGVHSVRQLLRTGFLDESTISRLERAIDVRLEKDTLRHALMGERAFLTWLMDMAGPADQEMEFNGIPVAARTTLSRVAPGWSNAVLRDNQIRVSHWLGSLMNSEQNRAALAAAIISIESDRSSGGGSYAMSAVLMPSLAKAVDLHFRTVVELRAARAALAAERYRIEFKRLPESFEDLVPAYLPAVPLDAFTDGPLQLKKTSEGIVIVSALMDDGSGANPPSALADADGSAVDAHKGHDHGDHGHAGHDHGEHGHDGHDHGTTAAGAEPAPHRHVRPPRNIGVTVYDVRFRGITTIGDD